MNNENRVFDQAVVLHHVMKDYTKEAWQNNLQVRTYDKAGDFRGQSTKQFHQYKDWLKNKIKELPSSSIA